MVKTAKQTRLKALPPASAQGRAEIPHVSPITAVDVWKFNNPEDVQASNALVGSNISDTLENCAVVLAFLSDFHARKPCSELGGKAESGLVLVVDWVLDAVEKQASELVVRRG